MTSEKGAEYRIKGLTMGRRSGAQNHKSQEPASDLSRPSRTIAPSASAACLACVQILLVLLAVLSAVRLSGGTAQAQTPSSASDENQRTGQHILNAPVGEDEAVLYRSTATMTPGDHGGNTHESREDRNASFVRAQAPGDFEEPDNYASQARLRGLDERRLGTLRAAISATDLTVPLTSVTGLRVGESLEIGRSGNTHNGEFMRIASIDTANNNVSVVERFDAFHFAAPQVWLTGTAVDHHRRARPENLPGYMVNSGQSPIIDTFRAVWQGMDVPYLAMNLEFPGGDSQLKDWEQLLIYMRFSRADGTGTTIEGILPLAADALVTTRPLGDPYTVREQHLRRYLGWPENLDNDPDGSQQVGLVNDAHRTAEFISGPERTFLQDMIDWIFEDNGHDLGRIYPWDDRYNATELAALEADPPTASEDVVRSYQIVVDVALLNGTDPRIDVEQFSITPPDTDPDGDGGGGGGGGGPRTSAPGAPRNLAAVGGDGEAVLTWDAPASDGGAAITDYEYRIDRRNPWISTGSTETIHTVTGLVNGTAYVFEVRAVNAVGKSFSSNRAEAMPVAPEVFTLDFAHFANGTAITSDLVFVNLSTQPAWPAIYFYDTEGAPVSAVAVVDVTGDLEIAEDGGLTVLTEMEPLGELTISTHGQGALVSGSVKVVSKGPIGGGVRYNLPGIGEAVVGASPPISDALFPARQQAGGIRTAAALHNLEEEAMDVSCRLMSGGAVLEEVEIPLEANGQTSWFIDHAFPVSADTSGFLGSVHCAAPGRRQFTGLAVEIDAANRIFTTLPLFPVDRGGGGRAAVLDFAHFANGDGTTSDLVFVNMKTQPSGPAPTPFHSDIPPIRPAIYFYDTEGALVSAEAVVDVTGDLAVQEDGALTVRTEMEPLGVLTVSTHGRGALVSGSVKVVSEGPIGGMLRFDLPAIGEAVVEASPPLSDALFPVRRQEGGITTGVAIHNLESSPGLVRCDLLREGVLRDVASFPLEANGQTSWLIDQAFPGTDTSAFVGAVRCDAVGEGLFSAVALEMDPGTRIFTTLPVLPVPERPDQ